MKNKIIVIAFAVIIAVLFVLPSNAAQIGGTCGDKAFWGYDARSDTLSIYGTGTMYDYQTCSPWDGFKTEIRAVVINGVSNVGEFAFYGCENLKNVYIGYTVKSIDYYAFKECTSLTSVYIPFGVHTIGWSAFQNCSALKCVLIPNTVTNIRDWAFAGCSALSCFTIPCSVTKIGNYAFDGVPAPVFYMGTARQWSKVDTGYYNGWTANVITFWR